MQRVRTCFLPIVLSLIVVCALGSILTTSATVVVPLPDEELTEHAAGIVIGQVTRIESVWDPQTLRILTYVTIGLEDALKGSFPDSELTIVQPGGSIGGVHSWVVGSPELSLGERVLLFLRPDPQGRLRVAHLFQGKYSIAIDEITGEEGHDPRNERYDLSDREDHV